MAASFRSARALRVLLAVSCSFPVLQACGGRSDTEDFLFDTDGTISVAGASANAGRGASSSGGRRPGSGGTVATGAASNTAGTAIGGAGSLGGSGIIEAGQPGTAGTLPLGGRVGTGGSGVGTGGTALAGSGGIGAAGAPSDTISCGSQRCQALTETCCLSGGFQCIPEDATCAG